MAQTSTKWVGMSVPRKEDAKFLTGRATFVDDMKMHGMLYCAILRSPYAHARIRKVDVSEARKIPGVVAIITGEDMKGYNLAPQAEMPGFKFKPVGPYAFALAVDKVRFVGEPVAAVAAVDRYVAEDALEFIKVEYDPLPAVVDAKKAMEGGSSLLYEGWEDNIQLSFATSAGDVDKAFKEAERIIKGEISEHRYSGFPIEGRAILASYNPAEDKLEVWTATQGIFQARYYLARTLKIPEHKIRVVAPNTGGGYGNKLNFWVEVIPALLSIKTGRPVKFTENRIESLTSMPHSRDYRQEFEVACKKDGTILGVKMKMILDLGMEGSNRGSSVKMLLIVNKFGLGPYKIHNYNFDTHAVVTNKSFGCAYRGFGKDIANRVMERIISKMSRELDIPPEEIRRKNFIQPHEFPYRQATGALYDSGNYPELLNRVMKKLDLGNLRKEKEKLRKEGRYIGIGLSSMVEPAGAAVPESVVNGVEGANVRINPEGGITLRVAHTNIGQGIETTFAQVVADEFTVTPDDVRVIYGDTDMSPFGLGTFSSRGAVWVVAAIVTACRKLKEKVLKIGAHILKVKPEEVELRDGRVSVIEDPSKSLTLKELAGKATYWPGPLTTWPKDLLYTDPGLEVTCYWTSPNPPTSWELPSNIYTTNPSSCEGAVVEVDIETGKVKVLKYVVAHDCGNVINPMIVQNQFIGGTMQGIGGTLYEEIKYDENGQPLTTTFMDYLMPTAKEVPEIYDFDSIHTPAPFTPLGTKGMGEGGAMCSPSVITHAVEDALGLTVKKTPLKPETVLELVKEARQKGLL